MAENLSWISIYMLKRTLGLKIFPLWLYRIAILFLSSLRRSKQYLYEAQKFVKFPMEKLEKVWC